MSKKEHFCRCYPKTSSNRKSTTLFCALHRNFICGNCVIDGTSKHDYCPVVNYEQWLITPTFEHPVICTLCNSQIVNTGARLPCFCLFHDECLKKNLISQKTNANGACPKCETLIQIPKEEKTSLEKFGERLLKTVNHQKKFVNFGLLPQQKINASPQVRQTTGAELGLKKRRQRSPENDPFEELGYSNDKARRKKDNQFSIVMCVMGVVMLIYIYWVFYGANHEEMIKKHAAAKDMRMKIKPLGGTQSVNADKKNKVTKDDAKTKKEVKIGAKLINMEKKATKEAGEGKLNKKTAVKPLPPRESKK